MIKAHLRASAGKRSLWPGVKDFMGAPGWVVLFSVCLQLRW